MGVVKRFLIVLCYVFIFIFRMALSLIYSVLDRFLYVFYLIALLGIIILLLKNHREDTVIILLNAGLIALLSKIYLIFYEKIFNKIISIEMKIRNIILNNK
nr:hypothetical protein [uncultured Cetobacterium sp.]